MIGAAPHSDDLYPLMGTRRYSFFAPGNPKGGLGENEKTSGSALLTRTFSTFTQRRFCILFSPRKKGCARRGMSDKPLCRKILWKVQRAAEGDSSATASE